MRLKRMRLRNVWKGCLVNPVNLPSFTRKGNDGIACVKKEQIHVQTPSVKKKD
jgi:hypothetical protein